MRAFALAMLMVATALVYLSFVRVYDRPAAEAFCKRHPANVRAACVASMMNEPGALPSDVFIGYLPLKSFQP